MTDRKTIMLKEITDKLDTVSPSMCLAKWTQSTIYLNSGFTHSCHHPGVHQIPLEGLQENPGQIHNTPFKQEVRQQMLDGKRPKECDYCWRIEDLDAGHMSDRMTKSNQEWSLPHFDEVVKSGTGANFNPRYIEVMFETTCNFTCTYCMPEVSSKWWAEINQHGPYKLSTGAHNAITNERVGNGFLLAKAEENPYITAFWKALPDWWADLHTFRITGGEPLLSKHTWKMMDFVEQNANLNLSFAVNSNLGVPKDKIDLLIKRINDIKPNLKQFSVYTSVESTGEQAEYIRYGMVYSEYIENVRKVLTQTTAPIVMMTTINALCYSTFKDFVETFLALRREFPKRIYFSFNYLRNPVSLDMQNLPDSIKAKFADDINALLAASAKNASRLGNGDIDFYEGAQLERTRDYMMVTPEPALRQRLNADLKTYLSEMDRRRQLDSSKVFPELWTAL